jgi:hypothetical protein
MFNPFIFDLNRKSQKRSKTLNRAQNSLRNDRFAGWASVRNRISLRLGMFLIRMGKEMTGGDLQDDGTAAYLTGGQAKTQAAQPSRLHHA